MSWRFIETPIRRIKWQRKIPTLLAGSVSLTLIVVLGKMPSISNGFESGNKDALSNDDKEWEYWNTCENFQYRLNHQMEPCDIGQSLGKSTFLLWGDSHAKALASAVASNANRYSVTGKLAIQLACPPLLSIERVGRVRCQDFNEKVLEYLEHKPEIRTVIMAGRWALSIEGTRYKQEQGSEVKLVDLLGEYGAEESNQTLVEKGLRRSVEKLKKMGKDVVIVSPVPEIGYHVPTAHFIATRTNRDTEEIIAPSIEEYKKRTGEVMEIFSNLEREKKVLIIDISRHMCNEKYCKVINDGKLLYRDDDHLSSHGSIYLAPVFDSLFQKLARNI